MEALVLAAARAMAPYAWDDALWVTEDGYRHPRAQDHAKTVAVATAVIALRVFRAHEQSLSASGLQP